MASVKTADIASDSGYVEVILNLRFMFEMRTYKILTIMCLSYHVEIILAPETHMRTYRQI